MEILVWAFIGGMVGAVLMDVTETYAAKAGITSGVNIALVGRWFLGLLRGQFIHKNILDSRPLPQEVITGWAFHFLIGGGGVALIYPLFFHATEIPLPENYLLAGMLFGLATSVLPWFVLLPSFGWGFFRATRTARFKCLACKHAFPYPLRAWCGYCCCAGLAYLTGSRCAQERAPLRQRPAITTGFCSIPGATLQTSLSLLLAVLMAKIPLPGANHRCWHRLLPRRHPASAACFSPPSVLLHPRWCR